MTRILEEEPLFCRDDLAQAIGHIPKGLEAFLEKIPEQEFQSIDDEEITRRAHDEFFIQKLVIDEEGKYVDSAEKDVEPDPDAFYMSRFHGSGPRSVPGTILTISVPFRGDKNLWNFRPSTWSSTLPLGNIKTADDNSGLLVVRIEQPHSSPPARATQLFENNMKAIRDYLGFQSPQVESSNGQLNGLIVQAIANRRERLSKKNNLSNLFGGRPSPLALREPERAGVTAPRAGRKAMNADAAAEFDIFISHSYEDKEPFVRQLAEALVAKGLNVWYDDITLRVGDSLRRKIDNGLSRSRFGVVVLSPSFFAKEWPQKELDGLVAKESKGDKVILPVWHSIDRAEVLRYSPILADRLAVPSSRGIDHVVTELLKAIEN